MPPAGTLFVMLKEPRLGAVKTRLAAETGVVEARRIYRTVATGICRRLGADPRWRTVLACTPDGWRPPPPFPAGLPAVAQGPGDLGARMQRLLDRAPPGPAAIVGSDVPDIAPRHVARALAALGTADVVFGPAEDGGFWLVGAKRVPRVPRLFAGVRWSGPHALADTLGNCGGLTVAHIDTLADIDDGAGWRRWRLSR